MSERCPNCDADVDIPHICGELCLTENAEVDTKQLTSVAEELTEELPFEPPPLEVNQSGSYEEADEISTTSAIVADIQPEAPAQILADESESTISTHESDSSTSTEDIFIVGGDGPTRSGEATTPESLANDMPPADRNNSVVGQIANLEDASLTGEIQYVNLYQAKETQQKDEEEKTLLEFTTVLPSREIAPPAFIADAVSGFLQKLKEERLLLISSPDEDLTISAALAVIDKLGFANHDQKRLLTFDRTLNEQQIPNIYHLRNTGADDTEIVVLVDAATERAKPFLDSIYYSSKMSLAALRDDLKRNNLYLLCLVEPAKSQTDGPATESARSQVYDSRFSYWSIPFLPYLLQLNYPEQHQELERSIVAQRERGWWKADDNEFYYEVRNYIARQELLAAVQAREVSPPPPPPNRVFQGDASVKDLVVYVATFFPNLTPHEFTQIVDLLLSNHDAENKQSIPDATNEKQAGDEGAAERLLRKTWRESPDTLLKECHLVTKPIKDSKGISFTNYKLSENLKEYLENEYCLYLEGKFQRLCALGLLFSPSARIGSAVINQTLEMMLSYSEYYGGRWLAEIVNSFEQTLIPGNEALRSNSPVWGFLPAATPGIVRRQVYQRVTELVQFMLYDEAAGRERKEEERQRLRELAEELFEQLIMTKNYAALLELIKRLKFAPGFDQFKWLKQLLDRGDPDIRQQVTFYLYGLLNKMDTRIYEVLRSLKSWLPPDDRQPQSYSVSAKLALQLLPSYCLHSASRFNEKNFGYWHGQYPLFTFQDIISADTNLKLLTKWLFHVGVENIFRDGRRTNEIGNQINILLTGWFFLLLGRGEMPADPHYRDRFESLQLLDGPTVGQVLLQRIVEDAVPSRLQALVSHWESTNRRMLLELSEYPYTNRREELTWKRNLIVELLGKLRQLRPEIRSPSSESRV